MKPRHFWALYGAKLGKKKAKSGLTGKDVRRLKLLLERESLKNAASP